MHTHFIRFSLQKTLTQLVLIQLVLILVLTHCCFASDSVRILFLTDTHIVPGNQHERAMMQVAEEIYRDRDTYNFAVVTGDITNSGSRAELLAAKQCFDAMGVRTYVIPGNHETCWSEDAGRAFIELWGNDRFEFRYGNLYCIGFSTGPHMKMGNAHVKAEDLRWLDQILQENTKDSNTKVLVFCHYPLRGDLGNWTDVTAILKKYDAVVVFCGHNHQLRHLNFDTIPGFMGWPLIRRDTNPPSYNVIEIKGDQLSVFGRELGRPQGAPFATITLGDPDAVRGIASETPPPTSGGALPDNVTITIVREEEASIFGGVAIRDGHLAYANSLGELKYSKIGTNANGKPVLEDQWKRTFKYSIYSTPVIASDRVIIGTPDNELVALSTANGRQRWRIETPGPVSGDFLLDGNYLYAGLGRDEFCKIDVRTGQKLWSYHGVDGRFQAAPALRYGTVAFGAWNERLYALDAATGKEQWVWRGRRPGVLFSPGNVIPVISKSQVVIVAPDRFMTAIDRATGRVIWRDNSFTVRESMGTSPDGQIAYAKTMNGRVIAVSAVSDKFELIWEGNTGVEYDHVACPLLLHEGVLYHGSPNGDITALDAETGARLWTYKLGNSAVNHFTPDSENRVWFTMIDGKIGCIETLR
jgi:outer membrane protein assembly factor BamB/predicted phosphodiesterase